MREVQRHVLGKDQVKQQRIEKWKNSRKNNKLEVNDKMKRKRNKERVRMKGKERDNKREREI